MSSGGGASRPSNIEKLNNCYRSYLPTTLLIDEKCPLKRVNIRAKRRASRFFLTYQLKGPKYKSAKISHLKGEYDNLINLGN